MAPDQAAALEVFAVGLSEALDELGEFARGIHPPILTERGIGPALKALARRSAIPVEVAVDVPDRLPEPVELAAYFVVSESLTNTSKHARANLVTVDVSMSIQDGALRIAVSDDGVGGTDFARGTGLLGLKDRVEALNGHLHLESGQSAGTTVIAELPITLNAVSTT